MPHFCLETPPQVSSGALGRLRVEQINTFWLQVGSFTGDRLGGIPFNLLLILQISLGGKNGATPPTQSGLLGLKTPK